MNQSQGSLFSKLLVPLIIVVIVVYLIASAWAGLRNPYQFTVAYADTMETSVTTSGWVVRSEQTVSGAEGVVQLLRNQGEKVGKGQAIAMVYQSETDVESQAELIQLEEDLEDDEVAETIIFCFLWMSKYSIFIQFSLVPGNQEV